MLKTSDLKHKALRPGHFPTVPNPTASPVASRSGLVSPPSRPGLHLQDGRSNINEFVGPSGPLSSHLRHITSADVGLGIDVLRQFGKRVA